MVEILYSPKFARQYKKLPLSLKLLAEKKERLFRENIFDPRLATHKLHGEFADFLAFSINYRYRIIFDFQDKNTVRFHWVGSHDVYK